MAAFLTDDWVADVAPLLAPLDQAGGPGGGRVQLVVSGGPDGEVRLGAGDDADLVLTTTAPDARAILDGDLAVNVAFMQGRLKTAGDNAVLLRLLPLAAGDAFTEHRRILLTHTD